MPQTKKKVKSIVKTKVISARVTETTHELLHQQAEDAGMTLSEFAAQMLRSRPGERRTHTRYSRGLSSASALQTQRGSFLHLLPAGVKVHVLFL